ncbi:hypothetical protein [uncultured Eubacterium sp.]|nr:hypothetical protein [uncultured Eubacterium sp.]
MGTGEIVLLAIIVFVLGVLLGVLSACMCVIASRGENTYVEHNNYSPEDE